MRGLNNLAHAHLNAILVQAEGCVGDVNITGWTENHGGSDACRALCIFEYVACFVFHSGKSFLGLPDGHRPWRVLPVLDECDSHAHVKRASADERHLHWCDRGWCSTSCAHRFDVGHRGLPSPLALLPL